MRAQRYFGAAVFLAAALWAAAGCGGSSHEASGVDGVVSYELHILDSIPHDPEAFTQGLLVHDSRLYESTGIVGRTSLREIDLHTGEILRKINVPKIFGEGLAFFDGKFVQITYQDMRAFVYNARDFRFLEEFAYTGEGWGLTFDGESLVMSDGSENLTFRDPRTFEVRRQVRVKLCGEPVKDINELEFIGGLVWANVWHQNHILMIRPSDGEVVGMIDASKLLALQPVSSGALNGIAFDPATGTIYLTGKNWTRIYRVELIKIISQSPQNLQK